MGTVAADQPVGLDRLAFAARLGQAALDRCGLVDEPVQLDRALDGHAASGQPFLEHALGLALGDHQRIGEATVDQIERNLGHDLLAGRDLRAVRRHARRQEVLGVAGIVEQFEGAAPQDECLGLVGALRRLVDDADGNAVAYEFSWRASSRPAPHRRSTPSD